MNVAKTYIYIMSGRQIDVVNNYIICKGLVEFLLWIPSSEQWRSQEKKFRWATKINYNI